MITVLGIFVPGYIWIAGLVWAITPNRLDTGSGPTDKQFMAIFWPITAVCYVIYRIAVFWPRTFKAIRERRDRNRSKLPRAEIHKP